ncbi:adhesion G-protein coupled receptor V1-like [Lytechinus variegatus]|uniref:adhesion G-protein coupled receptor V1-like n=1 Tax=Lytechinus variegatus TaxID=7654 RepID=UPI001BB1ADB6|nr:adhesion G-protein coupled receptor V1-like [Lytechinus variegatus]
MHFSVCGVLLLLAASVALGQAQTIRFQDTAVSISEGDVAEVRVEKVGASTQQINVVVKIQDPNNDFFETSKILTFDAGDSSSSETASFASRDDDLPEPAEVFVLSLEVISNGASIGSPSQAQVTVEDSDDAFGIIGFDMISPLYVNEAVESDNPVQFSLIRTAGLFGTVAVNYQISGGPNAASNDLSPVTSSVTFQEGDSSASFIVSVLADEVPENEETFNIVLTSVTGGARLNSSTSSIQVIIEENDSPLRFAQPLYVFDEDAGNVFVEVLRGLAADGQTSLGPVGGLVTVNYYLTPSGAENLVDYIATNGSIIFTAGETKMPINIVILPDSNPELSEDIVITLINPSDNAVIASPSSTVARIRANDDHNGVLSFNSSGSLYVVVDEETTRIVRDFVVLRTGGAFGEVTVGYRVLLNTSQTQESSGIVRFQDGQRSQELTIPIPQDSVPEEAEVYIVQLLPETVTGGARVDGVIEGTLVVRDSDDVYGVLQFSSDSDQSIVVSPQPRKLQLLMTRSGGRVGDLLVTFNASYLLMDGSTDETENVLETAGSSTTVFLDGTSVHRFEVPIRANAFLSLGAQFVITLVDVSLLSPTPILPPTSPRIGSKVTVSLPVTAAIANGEIGFDTLGLVVDVREPQGPNPYELSLNLTREGTSGEAVVLWRIVDPPGSGNVASDADYGFPNGSVRFAPGEAMQVLTVEILPDELAETDEMFGVELYQVSPENQLLRAGDTIATVIILENDNPGGSFEFSASTAGPYIISEGGDVVQIRVERTGGSLVQRSVLFSIEGGGSAEFFGAQGLAEFPPGVHTYTITLAAVADGTPELDETFFLALSPFGSPASKLGNRTVIEITVLGNDDPYGVLEFQDDPALIYIDESTSSNNQTAQFAVVRSRGTFGEASVSWNVAPAGSFFDLVPTQGIVTFGPGESLKYISITARNDQIPEGSESFTVSLSNPTGGSRLGTPTTATLNINKNDDAVFFEDPVNVTVSEPGAVTLTVLRNSSGDTAATVDFRTLPGTALSSRGDFAETSGQLSFPVGVTAATIDLLILEDAEPEDSETFTVQLFNPVGDIVVYGSGVATVTIEANDDPGGVFSFQEPVEDVVTNEESVLNFVVVRERGSFGIVQVNWVVTTNTSSPLSDNEDFEEVGGYVEFAASQIQGTITLRTLADGIPEFNENFLLTLTSTDGGGRLSTSQPLSASIEILVNDDPYGVLAFSSSSREKDVAEDFYPGDEDLATATFTVQRLQGTSGSVGAVWELYSDAISGNLPTVIDLLFLGEYNPSNGVSLVTGEQRQYTGTPVYSFSGQILSLMTIPQVYHPSRTDTAAGFTLSAWVRPNQGSDGFIISKVSSSAAGITYYGLRLGTQSRTTSLELRYSSAAVTNSVLGITRFDLELVDGAWHFVVATVDNQRLRVNLYVDGSAIAEDLVLDDVVLDGDGQMYVGASRPGNELYTGMLQDVRIYNSVLQEREMMELRNNPVAQDVTPISGTVTFAPGVTSADLEVNSVQDVEDEGNEVFTLSLMSARGGAALSDGGDVALLSVLKSDNANGLFGFSGPCTSTNASTSSAEALRFTCGVLRSRGDQGIVTIPWEIRLQPTDTIAEDDFVNASGTVVFGNGVREQTFTFTTVDDLAPEVLEEFIVYLLPDLPLSDDGLIGSTNTSGASIDPTAATNIVAIPSSDNPHGLLQFSVGQPPNQTDPLLSPDLGLVETTVREEEGVARLLVVRAQGLLGDITVEWRTVDGSAVSAGKNPIDFVSAGGTLQFSDQQRYAFISISIVDNDIAELEKSFQVQLSSPTEGAQIGPASTIEVVILPSDNAYGTFEFDSQSLFVTVEEPEPLQTNDVTLQVIRLGGALGEVMVFWSVTSDPMNPNALVSSDLVTSSGNVTFDVNQMTAEIVINVQPDSVPELDELFNVNLFMATDGQIGNASQAVLLISANDDPYGVFVMDPQSRVVMATEESTEVTLQILRDRGQDGDVQVMYATLNFNEELTNLPAHVRRAEEGEDFVATQGMVLFLAGQETANVTIQLLDDAIPETEESVFVYIISATIVNPAQNNPVANSPRVGTENIGEVKIIANDNANGVLQLSSDQVYVMEGQTQSVINVTRSAGTFGTVTVKFQTIPGTAEVGVDYSVTSTDVILYDGETTKPLPLEVINDQTPEVAETFRVVLLEQITGGAVLGSPDEAEVIIEQSDDPYGNFGFGFSSQIVTEPEEGETRQLTLSVIRSGGTIGVVAVEWQATINGELAVDDVFPTGGTLYFVSNDVTRTFTLNILPDDVPEERENVVLLLVNATGGGVVGDQPEAIISVEANDNPHGTVEFALEDNLVQETDQQDEIAALRVIRSGGNFGTLEVTYSTMTLDIISEATLDGQTPVSYYQSPIEGSLQVAKTSFDVSSFSNTLQGCAETCLRQQACGAFEYRAINMTVLCLLTVSSGTESVDLNTGFMLYLKDSVKTQALYASQAIAGVDYEPVTSGTFLIGDGESESFAQVMILNDTLPEQDEAFGLSLMSVRVRNNSPSPLNLPTLGDRRSTRVTIENNDDANGVWRLYSNSPDATDGGQMLAIEEQPGLSVSVELVIERGGGNIGEVAISWMISGGSATSGLDYSASGGTLTFTSGQTRQVINVGIRDDEIPEIDEFFTAQLYNPGGGSVLGPDSNVTIVILANDFVAGILRFSTLSYIISEGETFNVTVERSTPGMGVVTVDWSIESPQSLDPDLSFRQTNGQIIFQEGELMKEVTLESLPDETPETNENFQIILTNVQTTGVSPTGAASIDPQGASASINIGASDEPHGVFSFAQGSLQVATPEGDRLVQLFVERKYGAIGQVRVSYTISQGSLDPTKPANERALNGSDFVGGAGFVDFSDGSSSESISILINEDDIPELDEVFLVTLNSVELLGSVDVDTPPKLDTVDLVSEVTISANDGTQGVIRFDTMVTNIDVSEDVGSVDVTVLRDQGTYGEVSIFIYSQPVTARKGDDYQFDDQVLLFGDGESTKTVTLSIVNDAIAEDGETLELFLNNPTGGLDLGEPVRVLVTIEANDDAFGIVYFVGDQTIAIDEPTPASTANSVARFAVLRDRGTFGQIDVPFEVIGGDGDLSPTTGFVTFGPGAQAAVLQIAAVVDNIPELDEEFQVFLREPTGGAKLGSTTNVTIIIRENDAPYGSMQIFPYGSSSSSVEVEESSGTVYFTVARGGGDISTVTVDVSTQPGTAIAADGDIPVLANTQNITGVGVRSWLPFTSNGESFLLLLSDSRTDPLTTGVNSDGSEGPPDSSDVMGSMLFRWQGVFVPVQTLETDGAVRAASTVVGSDTTLIAIANMGASGRRQTSSRIYRLNANGSLTVIQDISTVGASDVEFFNLGSDTYLAISQLRSNNGQTLSNSVIYLWNGVSFTQSSLFSSNGASAVDSFSINGNQYLAVANYYDSSLASYEIMSVVYEWQGGNLVQVQQISTQGATDIQAFTVGSNAYLAVANSRNDVGNTEIDSVWRKRIYQWSSLTSQFVLHQSIPTQGIQSLRVFITQPDDVTHLALANADGPSSVYTWNTFNSRFDLLVTSDPAFDLVPLEVEGSTVPILASANYGEGALAEMSSILQLTGVAEDSDYVPWSTRLTFTPSDTELTFGVSLLDDILPEDDQTFSVYLSSPTNGAQLGSQSLVTVVITSNDDAHGIVGFAAESLSVQVEERATDTPAVLTVERLGGTAGMVVVEWEAFGQLAATDARPLVGQIEFQDGVATAPLVITVLADDIPELDETSTIRLTRVVNPGTTRPGRGATISPSTGSAELRVLANDSPHGVFAWNLESLYTAVDEPEGSQGSRSVTLYLTREQGFTGVVNVYYSTSEAAGLPDIQRAESGSDFALRQNFVTFEDGVDVASVTVNVLPDTDAEGPETFFVNLTSVELVSGQLVSGAQPSIKNGQDVAEVTIRQNDNANGILQLNVSKNADGDVEVYEGSGTSGILNLPVLRTAGAIGTVGVSWLATTVSASTADFNPLSGNVTLVNGQRAATISINIVDDRIYEDDERFTVSLHSPAGGAVLGSETSIIVKILKNDSPKGLFGFAFTQESVSESGGPVTFTVERTQGTQGNIDVRWEVEAAGRMDLTPSSGSLFFQQGDARKSIILEAIQDNILEGEERFTLSLTSATVDAEISPVYGTATVVILANPDSAGMVSILPDSRNILISEPMQGYDGQAILQLTRGAGIFGEVSVNWQISPTGDNAFLETSGQIVFRDRQQNATITIQTQDDSIPELRTTYTLVLASVTGGASIDSTSGGNQATIVMVASDNPFGVFEFDLPSEVTISEEQNLVSIPIVRNAGIFGSVQVSYTTTPYTAQEGVDFAPSTGALTFSEGVDSLDVTIAILNDDIPEGPEAFWLNITDVRLLTPTNVDYTPVNGLQPDMQPSLGSLSVKTILIGANDNAEGIIDFSKSLYEVQEDIGTAMIPVVRSAGNFGLISVSFEVEPLDATPGGVDFLLTSGKITLSDGQSEAFIPVTIIDDTLKEFSESFNIRLTGTEGGALLGGNLTATVVISKSDGPDGLIGFTLSNLDRVIANPPNDRDLTFTIELSGGLDQYLVGTEVRWRILGPNTDSILQTTDDISTPGGFLQGSVTFGPGQRGSRTFDLQVKSYVGPEVEEVFIVEIYQLVSTGEIDNGRRQARLTVLKHGDPNGIVQFTAESVQPRYFNEPSDGSPSQKVAFPLSRREGLIGDIRVHWEVRDSSGRPMPSDISPTNGTVEFPESIATASILLEVLPDALPELEEGFTVTLVSADGGAEIDPVLHTSEFYVNANDDPHGIFSVDDESQTIVLARNNRRRLQLTVDRSAGTVGAVQIGYQLQYNDGVTGAYVPSSGSVLCEDGQTQCEEQVALLNNDVFLAQGSTFTLNITSVTYMGTDTPVIPPSIDLSSDSATIVVPEEVANSQVGFSETGIMVDDATLEVTVTIQRLGTYGNVDVTWQMGYKPGEIPAGFMDGVVTPSTGQIRLVQGESTETFTVTLSPTGLDTELFAVHITNVFSNVAGGAVAWDDYDTARIDPYGIVGFSDGSRQVVVQETDQQVSLEIERAVGTLGSVRVTYNTVAYTAIPGEDYTAVTSGAMTLANTQRSATIIVPLLEDTEPELDKIFFVNITSVQRLPIGSGQGPSPKLSSIYSTAEVTIEGSNDPYGVLSIVPVTMVTIEAEDASKTLTFTVQRTGGSYGTIRVRARTVGGGESWQGSLVGQVSNRSNTIEEALANAQGQKLAEVDADYQLLEEELILNEGETSTSIYLTVNSDDVPEPDEVFFIYLSQPEGGARIAQGDSDGGLKGFTEVIIAGNDNYNGIIGFSDISLYVTVYEDVNPVVTLTLDRGEAFFENVTVDWRAMYSQSEDVASNRDLSAQLEKVVGEVTCEGGMRYCSLPITLVDDEDPEFAQSFLVELTGVGEGAVLAASSRLFANVTMADSDFPNGLLQFSRESRLVSVDTSPVEVSLTVERVGGTSKTVRVSWSTGQLQSPTTTAGVTIYPAIGGAEFTSQASTLVFAPGQRRLTITITLTPDNPPSSENFPKQFQVRLITANNGASVESTYGIADVVISEDMTTSELWDTWYSALTDTGNSGIYNVLQSLSDHVRLDLSSNQLALVTDSLNSIVAEGYKRRLPNDIQNQMMSLYCTLMMPTRSDSRGVYALAESFTAFSYTLVTGSECETMEPRIMECDLAKLEVARWLPDTVNGHRFDGKENNFFTLPTDLLNAELHGKSSSDPKCEDVHFIEYNSQQWFHGNDGLETLNEQVLSVGIRGAEMNFTNLLTPVQYRISTGGSRVTPLGASCILYNGPSRQWLTSFCSVVSDGGDFVECSCNHLSEYAVQAQTDNLIGYNQYVYASCFICIGGMFLALVAHWFCAVQCMFAAKLLLHLCFSCMALQIVFVISAYISSWVGVQGCSALGVVMHFFFLSQFTWMLIQSVNFWKVFILNDEHTDRFYVLFFVLGWALPALVIVVYVVVAYAGLGWDFFQDKSSGTLQAIYGDVNGKEDICFMPNGYAALATAMAPAALSLIGVFVVVIQAYQVKPQWKRYDDVYMGSYNTTEYKLMLVFWLLIAFTWLWGGLHMAYSQLWQLILFCIFNILQGLYAFFFYTVLRNQLCRHPSKGNYTLNAYDNTGLILDNSHTYSSQNLVALPHEKGSLSKNGTLTKLEAQQMIDRAMSQMSQHGELEWDRHSVHSHHSILNTKTPSIQGSNLYAPAPFQDALPTAAPPLPQVRLHPSPPVPPPPPAPAIMEQDDDTESQDFDDLIFALKTGGAYQLADSSQERPRSRASSSPPNQSWKEQDEISPVLRVSPDSEDHYQMRRINIADTHL